MNASVLRLRFHIVLLALTGWVLCNAFVLPLPGRGASKKDEAVVRREARRNRDDTDNHVDADVIVIGGGLVGLATAVALVNGGTNDLTISVYEKSTRTSAIGAAIGLYPNGLTALQSIAPDIYMKVKAIAIPSGYFERRDLDDQLIQRTDVQAVDGGVVSPVYFPWYLLQQHLAEALPPSLVQRGHTLESFAVQPNDGRVLVRLHVIDNSNNNNTVIQKTCRVLIGADGIYSTVRQQLFCLNNGDDDDSMMRPRYYGKIMYRAVLAMESLASDDENSTASCTIPPAGTQVSFQSDTRGESFSFRETAPGILTITAAVVAPSPKASIQQKCSPKERLQQSFREYPDLVQRLINCLTPTSVHEDWIRDTPIAEIWTAGSSLVILGDARGAMTPHMGQGANMGLEDACVLSHFLLPVLKEQQGSAKAVAKALASFEEVRKPRVTAVHEQSRLNSIQSLSFDKKTAGTPFARRGYTESFKTELYEWKPPT